ncbi:hypothetical protein POM88_054221 [Heracleum sosnowskyi]|uniref:Uncharacterized protein n=1 Tax=Heracleum sosnowskyi TaxID=360622 RepID=A0AAD8GNI3_9APIA|nr:hypothetical protein POM88_054221 [Heracleum sosnowskyi]
MDEYVSRLDDGDETKLRVLGNTAATGDGAMDPWLIKDTLSKNFNETIDDDKLKEFDVKSGVIQLVLAEDLDLDPNGKMISSKPLYIALAQSKVERRARLQAQFSQMRPVAMVPHMPIYPRGAPGTG